MVRQNKKTDWGSITTPLFDSVAFEHLPTSTLLKKKKKKKKEERSDLLVGCYRFLLLVGSYSFPLVYKKFGLTLYNALSYYVGLKVSIDSSLMSTRVVPNPSSRLVYGVTVSTLTRSYTQ